MPTYNPLDRSKPDTRPIKLIRRMQALEWLKQLIRILRVKPDTVILNVEKFI